MNASLRAVAGLLLAVLAPAACERGGGSAIRVVIADYSKDHTRPFWQGLAEAYTKQTGVKVDLQVIDWNSIDQQVSTMLQNNQPPDVLNLNSFSSYAKDGLLYTADEVLSPKTRDDFLEPFARGGEYRGKLYGFPILSSARAFFASRRARVSAIVVARLHRRSRGARSVSTSVSTDSHGAAADSDACCATELSRSRICRCIT